EGVNMKMITTADIKISVLVDRADGMRALRAVHKAFGLDQPRPGAGRPVPTPSLAGGSHDLAALTQRLAAMGDIRVRDGLATTDQGRITVFGLPDRPGNCSRLFEAVAAAGILVDMIVQNHTAGRVELSFSVPLPDVERAAQRTREVVSALDDAARVSADPDV